MQPLQQFCNNLVGGEDEFQELLEDLAALARKTLLGESPCNRLAVRLSLPNAHGSWIVGIPDTRLGSAFRRLAVLACSLGTAWAQVAFGVSTRLWMRVIMIQFNSSTLKPVVSCGLGWSLFWRPSLPKVELVVCELLLGPF